MNNNIIKSNDRIVELNGIEIIVHDNFQKNRRNIICYSEKLENYLKNNSPVNNYQVTEMLYTEMLDDIKFVSVKGFY